MGLWRTALGTAVGSFMGTYLWVVTSPSSLSWLYSANAEPSTLADALGLSHGLASLLMASMMFGFVLLLDFFFPPSTELASNSNMYLGWNPLKIRLSQTVWHPFWGGVVLGAQVGLGLFFMRTAMGSSSGFLSMEGFSLRLVPEALRAMLDPFGKLSKYYLGDPRWTAMGAYQACLLSGIVVGAALASYLGNDERVCLVKDYHCPGMRHEEAYDQEKKRYNGWTFLRAFIGAAVFSYGTRLVNGCTSGHGVSGMGMLSLASITYVVGIFAVGIATSYIEYIFFPKLPFRSKTK